MFEGALVQQIQKDVFIIKVLLMDIFKKYFSVL